MTKPWTKSDETRARELREKGPLSKREREELRAIVRREIAESIRIRRARK